MFSSSLLSIDLLSFIFHSYKYKKIIFCIHIYPINFGAFVKNFIKLEEEYLDEEEAHNVNCNNSHQDEK